MGISEMKELAIMKIMQALPRGIEWLDHLDILGVIRIKQFSKMNKIEDIFAEQFDGYLSVGIKKGTQEYENALQIMQSVGLSKNMLVDNLFLDDFVYLEIENLKDINSKVIINNHDIRAINQNETEALRNVINLYEKKDDLQNEVKEKFMNGADEYESLKMLHEWWNSIDGSFSITGVGKVIAYINAKRCIPELPDMLW